MRAVIQRVSKGRVTVKGRETGSIGKGFVVLLGISGDDALEDVEYLADKIVNLRVFEDSEGKMNLSIKDVGGDLLVISQFTLYGDCRKGRRPSFTDAAPPDMAEELYEEFVKECRQKDVRVETGQFQAHMEVELINDGPVTLIIHSKREA
ncbi:MAG: D-aminoacyl-tRNA deacylase [Clostridia bacterium]|jgi:D-tyrosyl-tRNA(Tyr) deacylase|nr:D-tyrosyl-tRNA(Tyr) deacylase [Clostridiales bacterium]